MKSLELIAADEARRILFEVPPVGVETVSLAEAAGRVLAAALIAPHDLPPARLSAMDGYAARAADVAQAGATLRVVGAVPAGGTYAASLAPGEAVSIATGALLPDGADTIVMVELTAPADAGASAPVVAGAADRARDYVLPGGRVRVTKPVEVAAHVVMPGEDLRAGTTVLAPGRRLAARDLAALAAFGCATVQVFRRPRIAVLATGSEICRVDETPRPGQVRDSNQYILAAEVESAGGIAVRGGIVADDYDALHAAVARLCAENDGVVLSGGSSVGPKDLTGRVLANLGAPGVLFHGIDIRPGKPTVFARVGVKPIVGMPGYPTSSMVVFEAFVRPMLARLGGESPLDAWPAATFARLTRAYVKPSSREDYLRVRLSVRDGALDAEVLPGGSSAISNVLAADGLARIPAGVERLEAGAVVAVRRF